MQNSINIHVDDCYLNSQQRQQQSIVGPMRRDSRSQKSKCSQPSYLHNQIQQALFQCSHFLDPTYFLQKDLQGRDIQVRICQYQFGCGILKLMGSKKQDFWPRIKILRGFFLNLSPMNDDSSKSAQIVLSKSIFHVKN